MKSISAIMILFVFVGCSTKQNPTPNRIDTAITLGKVQALVQCNQANLDMVAKMAQQLPEDLRQAHNSEVLKEGLAIPDVKQCVKEYRTTKKLSRPDWCFKNAFAIVVTMDENYQ